MALGACYCLPTWVQSGPPQGNPLHSFTFSLHKIPLVPPSKLYIFFSDYDITFLLPLTLWLQWGMQQRRENIAERRPELQGPQTGVAPLTQRGEEQRSQDRTGAGRGGPRSHSWARGWGSERLWGWESGGQGTERGVPGIRLKSPGAPV